TVHASVRELTAADVAGEGSPIGRPLSDLSFAVVDPGMGDVAVGAEVAELPLGERGELWISGAGVSRGYVNRPELTAERFVDATVGGMPGRWYRTGDEVRATPGAEREFEYIGRLDRQVQLRGFRIELGEVETALAAHDRIDAAVVELIDHDGDGPALGAFVTVPAGNDEGVGTFEDVRDWLSGRLPEHMLPSSVSVVDSLPLTANGKLDRAALRDLVVQPLSTRDSGDQPVTDTERLLAGIWSQVLRTDSVGRNDHFFTIGGDSMTALRLVATISKTVGTRVGIATLYRNSTVAELAAWVDAALEKKAAVAER
ncbi:phosphopantetheine-binding protein, partial [Streptomyces sp. NPDC004134]|uniref:phosphopantetheine-binding protein n=1 Tax=Streptomyces sp. NPDC004134 TaxID=3364691 RepID=UPI0036A65A18